MRVKLQVRWAAAIAGLIVLMATIVAYSLLYNFEKASQRLTEINEQAISTELMEQMLEQGKDLSQQLATRLTNLLYYYDLNALQQQLSMVLNLHDVIDVYVFDANGRIVQDGSDNAPGFREAALTHEQLEHVLRGNYIEQRMINQHILFVQPVKIGEQVIGGVSLSMSFEHLQNNIDEVKQLSRAAEKNNLKQFSGYALLITLSLAAIGATLAVMVARRHSQPIQRLVHFAQAIGSKKYQGPTIVDRNDELGDLARALNQMAINLEERTQRIEHLAYYDSLTELPNRSLFTMMLDKAINSAKRQAHTLVVFCIDLDGFKRINDTFGHNTGDTLIKAVSKRIHSSIQQSGYFTTSKRENNEWMLARLNGDEFSLFLLDKFRTTDATTIAHYIMESLTSTFIIDGHELMISASIGIATHPDNGSSATGLLRNAGIAMYRVKAEGKRDFKFFSHAMDASDDHRMSLELDLRGALGRNELQLMYQPIVDTRSGCIIGAEALVRWHSPRHGLVSPGEFIPIAEECGLINDIGLWIITTALSQLAKWNHCFDSDFQLSINISGIQLQKSNLATVFAREINTLDIAPQNIHLEVTETSLIFNKQASIKVLDSIKHLGIKIWLDDFGTGYSSLSHLKLFNVDGVKVDRSFVSDMEDNREERALAFAIIAMAKALDLSVVAEGVETAAQWRLLSQHHHLYVQGYMISEALSSENFENLAFKQKKVFNLNKIDSVTTDLC